MNPSNTARIIEWNPGRGFGFLDFGGKRLFLHIRDFAERERPPKKGDRVSFVVGADVRGRPCAKAAVHLNKNSRITIWNCIVLLLLLGLPGLAACLLPLDWRFVGAYAALISFVTYGAYSDDKKRARYGDWRIPESRLHWLELMGGWPGAYLAQKRFRHKISKSDFQMTFWVIVCLYQLVAFDLMAGWHFSQMAWSWVEPIFQEIVSSDRETLRK